MSFRARLTLFFVLIVIVPMIAVAFVLFRLVADSETGKADARVAEAQAAAFGVYEEARDSATTPLRRIGSDTRLLAALRARDHAAAERRARALLASTSALRVVLTSPGQPVISVGDARALAPRRSDLVGRSGTSIGRLEVSTLGADDYALRVRRFTNLDTVIARRGRLVTATKPGTASTRLPDHGAVHLAGREYRVASFNAPDFGGQPARVSVLLDAHDVSGSVTNDRVLIGAILLGFLVLSCGFALAVSRALQSQIGRFLVAARRIGEGDFGTEVPVEGEDEFAALGGEFNKMSRELAKRLEELAQERVRLRTAIMRTGEAAASNLDGDALLDNVVRTAVDGVQATCGRALMRGPGRGPLDERVRTGDIGALHDALRRAEGRVLDSGAPSEVSREGAALAFPLRESAGDRRVLGIVSVARPGRAFTPDERELFNSLAGQAAMGVENVELHERVSYQAIHDELTGLANHRRFQEFLAAELERARRFDQDTALILLDIDNFKKVNDTHGHQQGDLVLREVAQVVSANSREIDQPARYGGEEMVVALPQTDMEGAFRLAERMREAIEALRLPLPGGNGTLRVTASFGVASFPAAAAEKDALIAAADAALYEAKRSGKNRTVRAGTL
jgi:diguanylate cyclase (GGDEF)-like protein